MAVIYQGRSRDELPQRARVAVRVNAVNTSFFEEDIRQVVSQSLIARIFYDMLKYLRLSYYPP
jgi:citrate lyase beta subunit